MPKPTARVTVIQSGDNFTIGVQPASAGATATFVSREHVLAETVEALALASSDGAKVEFTAPDWVRAELGKLGYEF